MTCSGVDGGVLYSSSCCSPDEFWLLLLWLVVVKDEGNGTGDMIEEGVGVEVMLAVNKTGSELISLNNCSLKKIQLVNHTVNNQ